MKEDKLEIKSLLDGRWGIFKNGLCQAVVRSHEEAKNWYAIRQAAQIGDPNALANAIRKL